MKIEALQEFLIAALTLKPTELEKQFQVSHGVVIRVRPKLKMLILFERDALESLSPYEIFEKWYARSSKELISIKDQIFLCPDYAKMQELYCTGQSSAKTRGQKKTAPNKDLIIDEIYFSEDNKAKAEKEGLTFYSKSHVYKEWCKYTSHKVEPTFAKQHEMGQAAELDFNGPLMEYVDENNEVQKGTIVGIVFPATSKFGARVIKSQKIEDVIPALLDIFKGVGGFPKTLVVDNFKGAVTKASTYDGTLNVTFESFCRHFNMEVVTCRPYHPKDKGCVEAHMKIASRKIIARANLLSKTKGLKFRSLKELNTFVKAQCKDINNTAVRGLKKTRNELFAEEKVSCISQEIGTIA